MLIKELSDLEIRIYNASLKFTGELNRVAKEKEKKRSEKSSKCTGYGWLPEPSYSPIYCVRILTSAAGNTKIEVENIGHGEHHRWEIHYNNNGVLTITDEFCNKNKDYINFLAQHIPEVKQLTK
jgi:hypothetical protein